jgi:hypothetical protein
MILNKMNNFNIEIEVLISEKKINYIDAVVMWCEDNNIEVEYAADLIKKDMVLHSKIKADAESLNILKRTAQLPV